MTYNATGIKERPIIFGSEMVKAILAGKKSMTRRVMNPQPERKPDSTEHWWRSSAARMMIDVESFLCGDDETVAGCFCPYGEPCDRLWVRESWRTRERYTDMADGIDFKADGQFVVIENTREAADLWVDAHDNGKHGEKWRPSIYMPRWASRLMLEIVSVRVERLQEIRVGGYLFASDVQKEGCPFENDPAMFGQDEAEWFMESWDAINAKRGYGWDVNPFVWVIEFKRADS